MKGKILSAKCLAEFKNNLISEEKSVNSLRTFLGWADLRVKSIKLQWQIFRPEEKEHGQINGRTASQKLIAGVVAQRVSLARMSRIAPESSKTRIS